MTEPTDPATPAEEPQAEEASGVSEVRIGEVLSIGTLSDLTAAQGPLQPTVVDAGGVERIVGPAVDTRWQPAQVHPTEAELAHHEEFLANSAAAREERLAATQVSADRTGGGEQVSAAALGAEQA